MRGRFARVRWGGRWHRNSKGEAGFSLVEVLIALFVFAIASLAIAAMTFMSIQGNAFTNQMSQANFLAQDMMEDLLSCQTNTELDSALASPTPPLGAYTRSWVSTGPGPTANSRWLTVTVKWADVKGNHQVVARSLWRVNS